MSASDCSVSLKMLEPLLMFTVLNCFFMFSSTVTTCALWWQYRKRRATCSSRGDRPSKLKVKKCKGCENKVLKPNENHLSGNKVDFVGSKTSVGNSNDKIAREKHRDKKIKVSGTPMKICHEEKQLGTLEKLTSTEDFRRRAKSPSSDAKSTIVMEVSTVQKVVQIFENDGDQQHLRIPNETAVTYRLSPDNERKVEFIFQGKSGDKTSSVEKN